MSEIVELLYDGDCLFCTRSVRVLEAWDRSGVIRKVPFQNVEAMARHPDLEPEEVQAAVQFYDAAGKRWSGSEAFREMARLLPLGAPVAWALGLPGVRWLAARVYAWIARNRHSLGCHSEACDTRRK